MTNMFDKKSDPTGYAPNTIRSNCNMTDIENYVNFMSYWNNLPSMRYGEREPTVDRWEEVCSNAFSTTDAKMQRRKTTTHFRTSIKQCAEDAELECAA